MLDIGWTELLVVAVILIVVVGPKDLPPMIRAFGKMTRRLRQTAGEFRSQFDEALREAELDDLKKSVDDIRSLNPANSIRETLNPLRQMGQDIKSDLQRQTRYEPKTNASSLPSEGEAGGEGAAEQNSILADLPLGLDEPPAELRPVAVDTAAKDGPASTVPATPASSQPAAVPANSAPTNIASASTVPVTKKPAARKAATPKSKSAAVAAPAVQAVSAAKKPRKPASPPASVGTVEPKPAVKTSAKPRKTKSEDRA